MTRDEFLALKDHARIKYTGTRPVEQIFAVQHYTRSTAGWSSAKRDKCSTFGGSFQCKDYCTQPRMPKTFQSKGLTVASVSQNTWSSDPAEAGKISLYYYGGVLKDIVPEEWVLTDARAWVEGETAFKQAKSYIPRVARLFKEETRTFLSRARRNVEYRLDNLPLDKKLKLIVDLSPEDKVWFTILNTPPDEVMSLIEKAFSDSQKVPDEDKGTTE